MKPTVYLRMVGQRQGQITGSVTSAPHQGTIEVTVTSHEIVSPRDAATGQATGKRTHKPFVITKELDRSSPLLYKALIENETITTWELQFWQPSTKGNEKHYYTIQLSNAHVSNIAFGLADDQNPHLSKRKAYESVAFTYQKIAWTWVDGAITTEDDWEAPMS
jgi:type VI secretion system secreted protein Hcp